MVDDEQIAVPVKGGSLDGTSRSMFTRDLAEGLDFTVPSAPVRQAVQEATASQGEPVAVPLNAASEQYVLRRTDDWVFEYAGTVDSDARPVS